MIAKFLRFAIVVVGAFILTYAYWFLYGKPPIGIDDANIYFVYNRNLAEGHGFVYNVGGERVEGFTSMLWVLLTTPLYFVTQNFEMAVFVFNAILLAIALFISINFINRLTEQRSFLSIPVLLYLSALTLISGYVDWTVLTLMETGLWSLELVAIAIVLCNPVLNRKAIAILSFLLILLVLTRPESLLVGMVFMVLLGLRLFLSTGKFEPRKLILPVVAFAVALAGLVSFRLWYFNFPFPNTYYAKVSDSWIHNVSGGLHYFGLCVVQSPLLILICIAVAYSLLLILIKAYKTWQSTRTFTMSYADQTQFVLASISVVSLVIPINVGGDHFKLLRFYQPYFPIYLFVLLNLPFWKQYINVSLNAAPSRFRSIVHVLLLIPFIYFITDTPLHIFRKGKSPIQPEFDLAELGREEGQKMNRFFSSMKKLPSVGVSAAGGFAYGYRGHTNDLMGLNNVAMAHAKGKTPGIKNHESFDKTVFYQQSPEIFHGYKRLSKFVDSFSDTALYENTKKYQGSFAARLYKDMLKDQKFRDLYKPVIINDPRSKLFLKTYCHVNYLKELEQNGYIIQELNKRDPKYIILTNKNAPVEEEVQEEELAY